jgi:anti-sigma factor ChrR (cupin superfamily)
MTAITPKAPQHASLPPMASRFVQVAALPWEQSRYPGCETKTLLVDPSSGMLTMLMRMAPGALLPDHEHVLTEQTYVLQGSLVCGEGTCGAGDFVWRPAGSRHAARGGPEGCIMIGMFQIPNRFFDADGRAVDFVGRDWANTWGDALARQEKAKFN